MSATQTDARPHLDAVQALLNEHLAPWFAYAPDQVPGSPRNQVELERKKPLPRMFVQLGMEQRYVPPVGMVPRSTRGGWRITTQCMGVTRKEALWVMARVNDGLRNGRYLVDGDVVRTIFESSNQPVWDITHFNGDAVFTASH